MATENKKYIPALRFPEFQNDGEWKIVLLKDFTERIKSKVGNAQLRPISISAGIGFVDQKNKFGRDISGNQYSNYIVLKKGEFAYNKGNSIKYPQGCVYQLIEFEIVACPNVFVCFRIINNSVCPDFMSAYFASNYHGKQLQQYITSGVRSNGLLNISAETFLGIKTPLPSPAEQKKIADCLSSLDKYIDATKRKLELLKENKNGLMQRLFPAKGETVPEFRFPKFQNDGEWNYENGNDLYDSIVNKDHNSDLPILAITQENGAVPRDDINYRVVVEKKSIEGYKVVEVGDFIISLRSFQGGIEYSRYRGLCSPAYIVLRKKHNEICDDFYRHYFKSFQYIQELNRNLEGIRDGKMVSYKQFSDIRLPHPSPTEQKMVADCLSSLDETIKSCEDKISALELYKKGLMQQLFPKL